MQETNKHKANNSYFSPKTQQILNLRLTISPCSPYAFRTVAKSTVRCGSLLLKSYKANSTPLNRAFFVRNFRTPQKSGFCRLFSMVGRNRHAYAWLLSLYEQFFHPVTPYRPNRGRFSGSSSKLIQGLSAMIYKFLSIQGNKRLKITIYANSKAEALSRIQWLNKPLCIVSNLKAQGGVYA